MLVDPKSGKPSKVGRKRDDKTGKLVKDSQKIRRSNKIMKYIPNLKKKYTEQIVQNLSQKYKSVIQGKFKLEKKFV